MRTRRSNRAKRYTVEKYDFEGSSVDEEVDQPAARRQRVADERDANFDQAAGDDSPESEGDAGASESDASASGIEELGSTTRRRIVPPKPFQMREGPKTTTHLDIEPIVTDGHLPKGYTGTFDRNMRGTALVKLWYGPRNSDIETALQLLEHWVDWPMLPPKEPAGGSRTGVWHRDAFDKEASYVENWQSRLISDRPQGTVVYALSEDEATPYRPRPGTLPVLLGPHNAQEELSFRPGESHVLSQAGVPHDQDKNDTKPPAGWMLDAGGIVPSLDWARQREQDSTQLLAMAVIPHSDQEPYNYDQEASKPDFQKHGAVQVWEFCGRKTDQGLTEAATQGPSLRKTLCLDSGRARRVKWSPACAHLAILCGNGEVCVVEPLRGAYAAYEKVQNPIASLRLEDEGVGASSMAWVNFNRLAVGYSDGTIGLWSIHPKYLLSRHPVHYSTIVDMASGYPTMPYLVASIPVGGYAKLTDLGGPSYETTEVPTLSVNTMPNLLSWSEHLKGFFSTIPSSSVLNTAIGFMHHAYFPIVRRTSTADSVPTCLSVGRTHPFLLVGASDGSLYSLNPQFPLIQIKHGRRELTDRIRIFQHEHRPAEHFAHGSPAAERGASRIVHGFKPEKNRHTKTEAKVPVKKAKKKKKKDESDDDDVENDETASGDPTRGIVHEPLTRITAVEWNPNEGYGCWAAAAMGSGLVKIMDLGLCRRQDNEDTK